MKHRYTAKLYFEDGRVIENTSNDIDELTKWITDQAEATFSDVKGEIFDNHLHCIAKTIQFSPPDELK